MTAAAAAEKIKYNTYIYILLYAPRGIHTAQYYTYIGIYAAIL